MARQTEISIDLERNILRKKVSIEKVLLEAKMTQAAYHFSRTTQSFRVPEVVGYCDVQGWIDFEYLPNLIPLHQLLHSKDSNLISIMADVGHCLAQVQIGLEVDDVNKIELPLDINMNGDKTFLHGDFTVSNVLFDTQTQQITILDWSLTPWAKTIANWGTTYFDAAWMVQSIFMIQHRPNQTWVFDRTLVDTFLEQFSLDVHTGFDIYGFSSYCEQINEFTLKCLRDEQTGIMKWYKYTKYWIHLQHFRRCFRELSRS